MRERFFRHHTSIVNQKFNRKIIGPINDKIIFFNDLQRITSR